MDMPIREPHRSGSIQALTDDEIREGFRLLQLETEPARRAMRDTYGTHEEDESEWGELVTRSNAEQSDLVERFRAQLQPNPQ
jgi:hypothetical protein